MSDGQNNSSGFIPGRSPPYNYNPTSNYGNPNFKPPQQSFNRPAYPTQDPRVNDYYKNQYPATFQHFEGQQPGAATNSNQKNFSTSQFPDHQNSHAGQSDLKRNGNNFTLQRNSQNPDYQQQEREMNKRERDYTGQAHHRIGSGG